MQLNEFSTEYYFLEITTDPPVTTVEASFDEGQTWEAGQAFDGGFRWLVQGPRAPFSAEAIEIREPTIVPLVRYPSAPELRAEEAPPITLTS